MKNKLLHLYFKLRNTTLIWKLINKKGRVSFRKHSSNLSKEDLSIVENIKKNGIAVTSLEALFPNEQILEKLNLYKDSLNPDTAEQGKKKFLKKYWDKFPIFNLSNPFLKLTLSEKVLNIVNSYMEQWTILRYYDLAKTLPVGENIDAIQSQRWHRDPEEKKMVKMFIYLNDVDEEAGPFIYAYESQNGGKFGNLFPQETPLGIYPPEDEIKKLIPSENIHTMTGKAGTVIFCNTAGIHKGGFATKKERIMFTAFFSAESYSEAPLYSISQNIDLKGLNEQALFAISKAKRIN